ncbi:MAG: PIG-L family deacetylase [Bryobacteraceae bacterium]|jgi:LmbE family N-acetylglucosaminyl deacetylase
MSLRILSIHAHPDDAEILAGGTLAHLAARGHAVTIVSLSDGDCGSTEYSPEELGRMRRVEAQNAARLLGADYAWGGFHDLGIFLDDAGRRRVTALLRRFHPDLVLTASPLDYHCDHEAASRLVQDACFAVSCPNYDTSAYDAAPATDRIPHLYFMDPTAGIDRDQRPVQPQFLIDVTAQFPLKRDLLACHASQREWLRRQHGMDDYLDTMEQWTRARGALAGIAAAEGFRQYAGHPFPRTPLLQELLRDLLHELSQ